MMVNRPTWNGLNIRPVVTISPLVVLTQRTPFRLKGKRQAMETPRSGTLYIVATPIGNLEDITFRAVRILKEVDLIAAEDTRHSRKLVSHFGIPTRLTPYHDHNERLKTDYLLERLRAGDSVAIITDAGTPCIADPGYRIARAAASAGIRVVPVPGPSAIIAALSAAGLPTDRFAFEGFLPPKQGKRKNRLQELRGDDRVLIFYEAPHRLADALADMAELFGDRDAVVARELTKIHEEFRHGRLSELADHYGNAGVKGEIVILVSPAGEEDDSAVPDPAELLRRKLLEEGLSIRDAVAATVAATGKSRSDVYPLALKIREES
jgi:16S rRNA (cytidine1402-2'-O)-methyltransferase